MKPEGGFIESWEGRQELLGADIHSFYLGGKQICNACD